MRKNVATRETSRTTTAAARPKKRVLKKQGAHSEGERGLSPNRPRGKEEPLWDVTSIAELIKAFGGAEALNKAFGFQARPNSLGFIATDAGDWLRWDHIPNHLHLCLFGMAASKGITVSPSVFGIPSDDPTAQGLSQLVHAAVTSDTHGHIA